MLKLQEKCCIQRSLLSTIYLHTIHPNKRLTFIVSALWCRYYNISSPVKIWAWWGLKLMIRYPFKFVQSPKTLCSVWRDLQVFVLLALTLRKSYIWSNASSLDFASRVETSFSSTTLNLKGFSAAAAPQCATLHMSLRAQRHAKLRPAHRTSISRHIVQRVHKNHSLLNTIHFVISTNFFHWNILSSLHLVRFTKPKQTTDFLLRNLEMSISQPFMTSAIRRK